MSDALPPSTSEVFDRLWALSVVVGVAIRLPSPDQLRATLAALPPQEGDALTARGEQALAGLRERLESTGALAYMTDRERAFLFTPAHEIPEVEWMVASVRLEALAALAWALGITTQFPAFDAPPAVALLEILARDHGPLSLRPREEIERMREAAGLWHWRSQTRVFRDGLRPLPPGVTNAQLDDGVREAVAGAVAGGLVTSPIDGDLAAAGMAYSRMPEPEWRRVNAVTEQRLHALNWLCGYAPDNDWELTPLTA